MTDCQIMLIGTIIVYSALTVYAGFVFRQLKRVITRYECILMVLNMPHSRVPNPPVYGFYNHDVKDIQDAHEHVLRMHAASIVQDIRGPGAILAADGVKEFSGTVH